MYERIMKLIKLKMPNIDSETLKYYTNYFYVVLTKNILPKDIDIETLIDNTLDYAKKVEFYDENHWVYKKFGPDVKGWRNDEDRVLYVRGNLDNPLREMVIYHELHHAAQTNHLNNQVGINQEECVGRMIMEAQTQWFAEEVYKTIHNEDFEEKEIPSEEVRMLPNGTVVSKLHNYEMYDAMITKLAIFLDIPKEFFVTINFLYKDNKGLSILEERFNKRAKELNFKYNFNTILYILDYIYTVDFVAYQQSDEQKLLLQGNETFYQYTIHPGKDAPLSLLMQRKMIEKFDMELVLCLMENNIDCKEFSKYMISNEQRQTMKEYLDDDKSKQ